ncbi:tail fiber assembly protein [Escherichia coli]|nr:tail fiber assembly protein [Escherichia coli]
MQHLKNIKSGNPKTKEQYQLTKNFDVIWLYTEDGKNWYEEVNNFQEDTIKIVYDENNIIVAITKDASTLNLKVIASLRFLILPPTGVLTTQVNGCLKMAQSLNVYIPKKSCAYRRKTRKKYYYSRPEKKRSSGKHSLLWGLSLIQTDSN